MNNIIFLMLLMVYFISCQSKLKTDDGTIELSGLTNWPDSLELETYSGGGMVYEWNRLFISKDSCVFINSERGVDNRYYFILSQQELDQLLKDVIVNNIEKLGVKKTDGIIYDKGTTALTITLGRKSITIGDGASETITEFRKGDFWKIYNLLHSTADGKIAVYRRTCCFKIDPSIKLPSKFLSIISMTADTACTDSTFMLKEEYCFNLLQGEQSFQIHITQSGKVNYTDYFASIYPKFVLNNDTAMTLRLTKDSLLVME